MTDREGRAFLSHPNKIYGLFFLLTTKYSFYIGKTWNEYAQMWHTCDMVTSF